VRDAGTTSFSEIRGMGFIKGVAEGLRNLRIRKSGARTGLTNAKILGAAAIRVNNVFFANVFEFSRGFSLPGDSGSAVVNRERYVVSFVFAC